MPPVASGPLRPPRRLWVHPAVPRSSQVAVCELIQGRETSPSLLGENIQLSCLILRSCVLEGGWLVQQGPGDLIVCRSH